MSDIPGFDSIRNGPQLIPRDDVVRELDAKDTRIAELEAEGERLRAALAEARRVLARTVEFHIMEGDRWNLVENAIDAINATLGTRRSDQTRGGLAAVKPEPIFHHHTECDCGCHEAATVMLEAAYHEAMDRLVLAEDEITTLRESLSIHGVNVPAIELLAEEFMDEYRVTMYEIDEDAMVQWFKRAVSVAALAAPPDPKEK